MTRNDPIWTWLLTSLGSLRISRSFGWRCPSTGEIPRILHGEVRRGGRAWWHRLFECDLRGIHYENDYLLQNKLEAEWDKEFRSSIRRKYPDASDASLGWGCVMWVAMEHVNRNREEIIREYQAKNWRIVFMDWVPTWHQDDASEGEEEIFGPKAEEALNAWRGKHRIEDRGAIAKTLMLMVQTALVLQAFDPGPVDGVFGKRTLAAIAAWQTIQGFPEGAELAGLIAAILRAALVLEGYDPGPVGKMLGPSAIETAQAWAPSYEQATRNQGSRDRLDRLSPPTSWRTVPHAMDCVSLVRSGGARQLSIHQEQLRLQARRALVLHRQARRQRLLRAWSGGAWLHGPSWPQSDS